MISFFDLSDLQRFVAVWEDIQQSSVGNKVEARKGFLLLLQVIIPTKNSTMRTTGLTVTLCFTVITSCCIKIASLRTWQWSFAGVQGICDVSPWLLFQDRQQNHNPKKRDATRCNVCFENYSFLGFGSRQSLCSAFCGANVHDQRRPGGLGAQRQAKTCQSPKKQTRFFRKKLHIVSSCPRLHHQILPTSWCSVFSKFYVIKQPGAI